MSTILLVEDDHDIRECVAEFLTGEGFSVRSVADGIQALDTLQDWRPNLILLDLMMPTMDGFMFREAQMKMPPICDIPVVIMSAYGDLTQNKEKLQVEAYLKKPLDLDELLSTIHRWSAL